MKEVGEARSWPKSGETAKALGLALVFSVAVGSFLIIVGSAVASNFVEGMSVDAGWFSVLVMLFSLVIIWPVALGPLVFVFLARRLAARMPVGLFVAGFATTTTFVFVFFLRLIGIEQNVSFVTFVTSSIMLVDGGVAFMIAGIFAMLFRMFLPHPPG